MKNGSSAWRPHPRIHNRNAARREQNIPGLRQPCKENKLQKQRHQHSYVYICGIYFQQAMLSTHTHTHLLNPLVRLLLWHGEDADWVQPNVSFNWLIVQPRHRSSRKLLASVMRRPQHERHGVSWFEQIYKTVLHNRSRTSAIWTD